MAIKKTKKLSASPENLPVVDEAVSVKAKKSPKKMVMEKVAPMQKERSLKELESEIDSLLNLPVLAAEVEESPVVAPKVIEVPKPEPVQPIIAPRAMLRPIVRPPIKPSAQYQVKHVGTQSATHTKTKTAVAVSLIAAGALALAAGAALLSLRSNTQQTPLKGPYATIATRFATMTLRARSIIKFVFVSNNQITPGVVTDIVGDGSEHAIASFKVNTLGSDWTFEKMRVNIVGYEMLKGIMVRDEIGRMVSGSYVAVSGMPGTYDLSFSEDVALDSSKVYTVYASFGLQSGKWPAKLTVMKENFVARTATGEVSSALAAPISGPDFRVVAAPKKKK
ncbi:MAG: hypothetical protein WCJ29_01675 [bacterium]